MKAFYFALLLLGGLVTHQAHAQTTYFGNGTCGYTYVEPSSWEYPTLNEAIAAASAAMVAAGCPALPGTLDNLDWSMREEGDMFVYRHFTPPDPVSDWQITAGSNDGSRLPSFGASAYTWNTSTTPTSPVPEPSINFMMACGLTLLFAVGYIGGHQR